MKGEGDYEFGADADREAVRLASVERAFDPVTQWSLREAGVSAGWRCWEVGAGNGSIARWLADLVGSDGYVLATDLDERRFRDGDTNAEFLRHDVTADPPPAERFDLVHARFLLEHLPHPPLAIARIRDSLRPGGVVVLEDSADLRIDTTPESPLFDQLASAWELAGRTVGWTASYGHRLMADLGAAGLTDLRGHEYRQLAPGGDSWAHLAIGLERLHDQLLEQGVGQTMLQRAIESLRDRAITITGPPVLVAWARR